MSCGSEHETANCVCDTLLAIVEAQDKVEHDCTDDCLYSCHRSIQELVGGSTTHNNLFNTIPVLLINKFTGTPFVTFGAIRNSSKSYPSTEFRFSYVFRVVEVDPESCCATLELLGPETPIAITDDTIVPIGGFLNDISCEKLVSYSACVTVDLNTFSSVTCFPPIEV